MKLVKPIKDRGEVRKFSEALYEVSPREFALFVMGITWGLRISDMLALRVGDVVAGQGKRVQLVKELYIRERKTGKLSCLCTMTDDIRRALWTYLTTRKLDLSSPLFLSRERRSIVSSSVRPVRLACLRRTSAPTPCARRSGTASCGTAFPWNAS